MYLLPVFSSWPVRHNKPPRLPVTETGAVCYALFVLSQALTQSLAGVLDSSLSGCQNCRALGFTIFRYLKSFQLTFTTFCLFSPSWGHKRYLQYFHWFNTVPIIPAFKQSLDSDHAAMLVSRYNLLPTEC